MIHLPGVLAAALEVEQFCTRQKPDARDFALMRRVLLARTAAGIDIDIAMGAFPFEERSIGRASPWSWNSGQSLTTCSAEDLVVHKVFAGRDRIRLARKTDAHARDS